LLEFPAEEIADQLMAEAEERERTLPSFIHFVVSHEQAELIDSALSGPRTASLVGTGSTRSRHLAKRFLDGQAHGAS